MAQAPTLLRTNTAPVFTNNNVGGMSSSSMNGPRASQLSGSTQFGSALSLASMSTATTLVGTGGPVQATSNIINQKADASRSLYQICVSLKQRLSQVPGFEGYLADLESSANLEGPVESLWSLLRTGYPLLDVYNSLQPVVPISVEDSAAAESKRSKIAVFKFVQGCLKDLNIPPAQCFVINDLMGNDTTGFVKVIDLPFVQPPTSRSAGLFATETMVPFVKMLTRACRSHPWSTMFLTLPSNEAFSTRLKHSPKPLAPPCPACG